MGARPWPAGASDKQLVSTRMPMHSTGAQCPVHQEGTAMGAMPWFVEAEPDQGEGTGPGHGHLDMAWAHTSAWGRHTDAAGTATVQSGSGRLHHHHGKNCRPGLLNRTPAALRERERKERRGSLNAWVQAPEMAGGSAMEALRERMTQLEEALGEWPREDGTFFKTEMHPVDEFKETCTYGEDIAVLKKAVLQDPPQAPSKVRVPSPKASMARNAKVENFLWDIGRFFKARYVSTGDAKLWWRTRMEDDAESGRPQITTWETLKKELKDQFLPTNTAWVAVES
ncbi:hypothetical protein AAG906_024708 [Vitis piasezkii]